MVDFIRSAHLRIGYLQISGTVQKSVCSCIEEQAPLMHIIKACIKAKLRRHLKYVIAINNYSYYNMRYAENYGLGTRLLLSWYTLVKDLRMNLRREIL